MHATGVKRVYSGFETRVHPAHAGAVGRKTHLQSQCLAFEGAVMQNISNHNFWVNFEQGRDITIRDLLACLAWPAMQNANTVWRKLLYSGFHTPKAVTYHEPTLM